MATDDDASGTEDNDVTIAKATLLANDSDGGDGGALSLTAVSSPSGGTVEISGSNVVFHPAANLCGDNVASFEYAVSDGTDTDTGLVTVDLACVDDPPVSVNDAATVLEDAAATTIDVLANDTDMDGGPKAIASAGNPETARSSLRATTSVSPTSQIPTTATTRQERPRTPSTIRSRRAVPRRPCP